MSTGARLPQEVLQTFALRLASRGSITCTIRTYRGEHNAMLLVRLWVEKMKFCYRAWLDNPLDDLDWLAVLATFEPPNGTNELLQSHYAVIRNRALAIMEMVPRRTHQG